MYKCVYCKKDIELKDVPRAKKVRAGGLHKECCDEETEFIFVSLPEDKSNGFYELRENMLSVIDSIEVSESILITKVEMTAKQFYDLPEFDGF